MSDIAITLHDVDGVIMERYRRTFDDQNPRLTGGINNLIRFRAKAVQGDGENIKVKRGRADSFRTTHNPLADFPGGRAFDPRTYKVRWNELDTSAHDFTRFAGSAAVSHYELQNAEGDGSIVAIARELVKDLQADYSDKLAAFRMIPRTARMGVLNSDIKDNDAPDYDSCSAFTANGTTARAQIDAGSISYLRDYRYFDIYSSGGTLLADAVRITDVNPADDSFGFETTSETTTGDLDALAADDDNAELYVSGTKDIGMYSIGAWMGRPTAGESFIGGTDRTSKDFRWMLPVATREGATSAQIAPTHFDDLCQAMGYAADENTVPVVLMTPDIFQSLRQQLGHDAFSIMPIQDERFKKFAHYGRFGIMYQHPIFGPIMFQSHNMVPSGTVWFLAPDTWEAMSYGRRGLERLPGAFQGFWERDESSTPGNGKTLIYRTQAMANHCDICTMPQKNGTILNVTK